jgi:hypothetical protein
MLVRIKSMIGSLAVICLLVVPVLSLSSYQVSAAAKDEVCKGVGLTGADCNDPTNSDTVQNLIADVIGVISFIVGIAAVIMIMVGGFKYITSQGDGNSISSAKNTILYAVIGLVVALFAQLIVRFVINRV